MSNKSLARAKAETEVTIHNALVRLGSARRERLADEDYDVYADGLRQFPASVVAEVCEEIARKEPEEFGPRYPTLGAIRQACIEHVKRQQQQREMNNRRRMLPEGRPLSDEKFREFRSRVAAELERKGMR